MKVQCHPITVQTYYIRKGLARIMGSVPFLPNLFAWADLWIPKLVA